VLYFTTSHNGYYVKLYIRDCLWLLLLADLQINNNNRMAQPVFRPLRHVGPSRHPLQVWIEFLSSPVTYGIYCRTELSKLSVKACGFLVF